MVCRQRRAKGPEPRYEVSELSEANIPEMLALTSLTHPGPFRPHTYTLGTYLGIHVNGRLIAMAGQRMHLPGHREISAVCTHPEFTGRGLARMLVSRLVDAVFDEGLTPFLHVEESNVRAQAVYTSLGFAERRRLPVLVAERVD
jgi:predicted GNAT family acetyltransferase